MSEIDNVADDILLMERFGFWNYRVIQHEEKWNDTIEVSYGIHECFYSENDRNNETAIPHSWTADTIPFIFYEPEEAKKTLEWFQRALERSWFKIVDDKLVEIVNG